MIRRVALLGISICLALSIASCGPLARRSRTGGGGGGGGSADLSAQCRGDFGATAAANRFEAFMGATYELHQAAEDAQRSLLLACRSMGEALEMPAAELSGDGVEGMRDVCAAVSERLRTELAAAGEGSETTVEVRTSPPRCEARFDAYASCAAECDVNVTPGELEMQCEGGELRGGCSGECSGRCAVDVSARCEGTCEGICDGTCSAQGADGSCAGTCDGTCRGECVTDASASCSGECRGSCSVEWQEPYCTGSFTPPEVDADCQAACDARVEASMECTPGTAELVVTGGPDAEAEARLARVREAIRVGLASVIATRERMERVQESGRRVLAELEQLPTAIRDLGVSAAACSASALANLTSSMQSVSVSFEVSVSVSASASASAG